MDKGPPQPIKPISVWQTALFFGIPTFLLIWSIYWFVPWLLGAGLSAYMSLEIAFLVPFALLFCASLVAYRLEGNAWTWTAFTERFRLRRMNGGDWAWTTGLFVFALATYLPINALISRLVATGVIDLPGVLPVILDPRIEQSLESLTGGQIRGNGPLALVSASALVFNTLGEEFWWRGYILPRQQTALGRYAWVVHGVLWTLFHAFKYWEFVALAPTCLALAYVAQRRKSTWPGVVTHFALNGMETLYILLLVAGVVRL